MKAGLGSLFAIAACILSACTPAHDSVAPGYYGRTDTGMMAGEVQSSSVQGGQNGAPPMTGDGCGAVTPEDASPDADQTEDAGSVAGNAGDRVADCDLSGRWLSTVHSVTDALGSLQYSHTFNYYEIEQEGEAFIIRRALRCGDNTIGMGVFAVDVDFSATWASVRSRANDTGRRGTSTVATGGCRVELERWYVVRGATLPYYLDPSIPLPTADQQATDTMPGWEDWDQDGNPGITGEIAGIVTGSIFLAPRVWTAMVGTVPDVSSSFTLPTEWDQESNIMAFDGSPLLGSTAARAPDPALHFTQFARLSPDQAAEDDAAICERVIELAPALTPEAAAAGM